MLLNLKIDRKYKNVCTISFRERWKEFLSLQRIVINATNIGTIFTWQSQSIYTQSDSGLFCQTIAYSYYISKKQDITLPYEHFIRRL